MRRSHFEAFRPHCPRCAADGRVPQPLVLAQVAAESAEAVEAGILLCPAPDCAHEYPIVDGIPLVVADLPRVVAERATAMLLRDDLDPALESLLGDATGPGSWFDALRQVASTYGWDAYADLDPQEPAGFVAPGAARRCLARLLELSQPPPAARVLDLGCGAGRTSFALAAANPRALVLGIDLDFGLLRLAHGALHGLVSYPRRRIGLVYDRRRFAVSLGGAGRVDFWCCDAAALPLPSGIAEVAVALNLLDCVPEPHRLLAQLAASVRAGGRVLLATPYDWSTRATAPERWIGGHSQRAPHAGSGETFLHRLLTPGAHENSVAGLRLLAEDADLPWHTRLHDRSAVSYRTHGLALERVGG